MIIQAHENRGTWGLRPSSVLSGFQLRSCPQGHEMEPRVGLHVQCRVDLRILSPPLRLSPRSLSLFLFLPLCSYAFVLTLFDRAQIKKILKNKKAHKHTCPKTLTETSFPRSGMRESPRAPRMGRKQSCGLHGSRQAARLEVLPAPRAGLPAVLHAHE